jgi:4-nitrophenyl phosphatase
MDDHKLIDSLDTLLLDCDGVLWRGNELLPHVVETLNALRQRNKRVLFVTNNASKSRREYVAKFAKLGMHNVTPDDIISSAYAAGAYLAAFPPAQRGKVLVLGAPGLAEELRNAGAT